MSSYIDMNQPRLYFSGLDDNNIGSMRVLSETASDYPEAISFSSGAPYEEDFDYEDLKLCLDAFKRYFVAKTGNEDSFVRKMFHYSDVSGFTRDIVADYISTLDDVYVTEDHVMLTNGFQEALLVALRGLCGSKDDVLLSVNPAYVGVYGAARMLDIHVEGVFDDGNLISNIKRACTSLGERGKRAFALYVNPDNNNPRGVSMTLADRRELLKIADEYDLFILEDNPYRIFSPEETRLPSLKYLDDSGRVIVLGSFSKSVFPGARLGYIYTDQMLPGTDDLMVERFTPIKSMYSVGTSSLSQAVVAGALLSPEYGLWARIERARKAYLHRLDLVVRQLEHHFPPSQWEQHHVAWEVPEAGFFIVLKVGFDADIASMRSSAKNFGVSWAPMRMFYQGLGGEHEIRLGFSNLNDESIVEGIARFARFNKSMVEVNDAVL